LLRTGTVLGVAATILLVRHGETDWNRDDRFQGHADLPLNDSGREQARALASALAGDAVAAVYSSPLRRACETAQIVATRLGLTVSLEPRLMEVDVGSWSGLTRTDVERRFPEGFARWRAGGHGWDDGETYEQLTTRVLAAIHDIAERHVFQRVAVVGHGGTVRAVLSHAEGLDPAGCRRAIPPAANCSVHVVSARDGALVRGT
jgi:broad specificity phosphatase PhoE